MEYVPVDAIPLIVISMHTAAGMMARGYVNMIPVQLIHRMNVSICIVVVSTVRVAANLETVRNFLQKNAQVMRDVNWYSMLTFQQRNVKLIAVLSPKRVLRKNAYL
jgi:hypothetical protein